MKKLTIAIPTYNRAKNLLALLNDLAKDDNIHNVYIYISDNCSEDNTKMIVDKVIKSNPQMNIKYSRNEKNIGFDANVLKCYDECKTDYIWILSDDDKVIENSISKVLAEIEMADIICLNDLTSNNKLGLNSQTTTISKDNEVERWAIISKFFFISRFVAKKISIQKETFDEFIGTGLMHLAILNHILLTQDETKCTVTNYPVLINQPHCVFSHNFIDVFVNKFYDFCTIPQSKFSNELALNVARANIPFVINGLLSHKVGTKIFKYDFKFFYLIRKMIKYKCNYKLILKFIAIYLIPTKLVRLLKKTKIPCIEDKDKRTYI